MSVMRRYLDYVEPVRERMLPWLPRHSLNRALGWAAGQEPPRQALDAAIAGFVKIYGVKLDEAEIPKGGYASFDAFFTRKLRADARPICWEAGTLVSPADGTLVDAGAIEPECELTIKGQAYGVAELLGEEERARHF